MDETISDDQYYKSKINDNDINYVNQVSNESDDFLIIVNVYFLEKDQLCKIL